MKSNDINIIWLGHASFLIEWQDKNIYIDPYKIREDLLGNRKADYVFITHEHYDHCSLEDLKKIINEKTQIIIPSDCMSKIARLSTNMNVVQPLKRYHFGTLEVLTVPAYNSNKPFHPKENEWVGYVINFTGTKIYHAGDTDVVHEMAQLQNENIDIALLPVGGTYTMDANEASYAAKLIKPKIIIPMHYGSIVGNNSDAQKLKELLQDEPIKVEILKPYQEN